MTAEEAKEIIIKERDSLKANPMVNVEDCLYKAFEMAIKALEQQICDNDCEHCDWVTCPKMEEETETITVSKGCLKARKRRFVVYDVEYLKSHIEQEMAIYGNVSAIKALEQRPTRPTGKWIDIGDEGLVFKCSLCGLKKTIESHYCPNCGAKMEESEEEA